VNNRDEEHGRLQQRGLRLEYATIAWNALEMVIAIGLGLIARSLALVAFGLDTMVELFASGVVVWHLRHPGGQSDRVTARALRLVAVAFFALALTVTIGSVWALVSLAAPDESPLGIAYLAITIPDFPNLFMLNGPNGPVGNFSLIEVAELQFAYIMQLIEMVRSGECREVSATHEASERFDTDRVEAAKSTVWTTGCRSWYLDDRGVPAAWPWTFDRFREVMAEPDLDDFDIR